MREEYPPLRKHKKLKISLRWWYIERGQVIALLNKKQEAVKNLRQAVALGWRDVPAFKADELFSAFRRVPSFAKIIEKLEKQTPL